MYLWHGRQHVAGYLCYYPFVPRLDSWDAGRSLPWHFNVLCLKIQDNQSIASPG